jgi:hypothetical protein
VIYPFRCSQSAFVISFFGLAGTSLECAENEGTDIVGTESSSPNFFGELLLDALNHKENAE